MTRTPSNRPGPSMSLSPLTPGGSGQPEGAAGNTRAGFTLTEFIVALILVGIGLALSLGMIMNRGWREGYNLTNMATGFQTTLQMARARAVAKQGAFPTEWHFGDPATRYG